MRRPSSRLTNNVWVDARRGIARRFEEADSIGRRLGNERPATKTDASLPVEQGRASSIGDSLTSSIGFEDVSDLIADLDQALAVIS